MTPETLHSVFEASLNQLEVSDPSRTLRSEAMASFNKLGYPTKKHENWRYTDLKPIVKAKLDPTPKSLTTDQIKQSNRLLETSLLDADAARLVLVDGVPLSNAQTLSDIQGLTILGHKQTWQRIGELQSMELFQRHPLAALNTAFTSSGILIKLSENTNVEQPLHLVFISAQTTNKATQPRILIDIGAGSKLTIVQHFIGEDSVANWTNLVTQITQSRESQLTIYRFQEYGSEQFHTELLDAKIAQDAKLKLGYVDLGGKLVRNDVQVNLAEPGAACEIFGVFLAIQGQHVDNHTRIDHTAPQTTSREAFRGIIGEHGRGVFNGKVIVHRGAHGADAQQSSDNLLLSEHAEIDTKPELKIYTDDVKCAHGATVGELDAEQLFYIRSRGVDEDTAKGLLTFAFANDVLRRIEVPEVRERVASCVAGQLPDYENWGGLL